jgi:NADPH:quinone reductase-like Zn-dependent oxidoreductase
MKAVYLARYGGPEVVRYGDRPMPEPGAHQVLMPLR